MLRTNLIAHCHWLTAQHWVDKLWAWLWLCVGTDISKRYFVCCAHHGVRQLMLHASLTRRLADATESILQGLRTEFALGSYFEHIRCQMCQVKPTLTVLVWGLAGFKLNVYSVVFGPPPSCRGFKIFTLSWPIFISSTWDGIPAFLVSTTPAKTWPRLFSWIIKFRLEEWIDVWLPTLKKLECTANPWEI